MAFIDIRLPNDIEQGAQGGPEFKTNIITTADGNEQRNAQWSQERGQWDISYGPRAMLENANPSVFLTAIETILRQWKACQGRLHTFPFKDWGDYIMNRQIIGVGDGTTTAFQIFKTYSESTLSYQRYLYLPILSTLQVWVNNSLVTTGFSVSRPGGIISFNVAPTSTYEIDIACQFDCLCRFDIDQFTTKLTLAPNTSYAGVAEVDTMSILEVKL